MDDTPRRRLMRCLLLFVALVGLSVELRAQSVVALPDAASRVSLDGALLWWHPPLADADLADARLAAFKPAPPGPGFGLQPPTWFRADLRNEAPRARDWWLEIAFGKLDYLDAWVVHADGRVETWATGDARPWDTRVLPSPRFLFPLSLGAGETATLYLRVESSTVVNLPLALHDARAYPAVAGELHAWLGVFYGLVLGLLAYNTYLFRTTRERAFLHYIAGCALAMGYFLSMDGLLAALLPGQPAIAQRLLFVCGTLSVTFVLLFARRFLELPRISPRQDRLLRHVAVAAAVATVAVAFLPMAAAMAITIGFSLAMAALMSYAGVHALLTGFRPARWFVLAVGVHLAVLALVALTVVAILPWPFSTADLLHRVGFVLNLLCFTLAIGDRIRHIELQRRDAEARVLAAAADVRARNEFLSQMSHELRTPMTGVLGMAELLEHTGLEPKQRRYLGTLRFSGEMLLNLINDILDHARLQANRLQVSSEAFDLLRLVDECRVLFEQQPRDVPVALRTDIGTGLSRVAVGDAQRVRQVLINLLAQAFRQATRGDVTLRLRALDPAGWLRFEVEAPGDARESALRLLEGEAGARGGLGLVISRELVQALGGCIGIGGDEARTLYWFELPLNAGQ